MNECYAELNLIANYQYRDTNILFFWLYYIEEVTHEIKKKVNAKLLKQSGSIIHYLNKVFLYFDKSYRLHHL